MIRSPNSINETPPWFSQKRTPVSQFATFATLITLPSSLTQLLFHVAFS
jgi:hypothetical protein